MEEKKLRITNRQFAEVLFHWLSMFLTKKEIKKYAKSFGFRIRIWNRKDYRKIFEELLILNMWMIVYTCEKVFEGEDKRNECLDIFHNLIYHRKIANNENSFRDWMISISSKYIEYSKAMETEHPSTPLWLVAKVFNQKLFGKFKEDLRFQMQVCIYIDLFNKHLGKTILKYEIDKI